MPLVEDMVVAKVFMPGAAAVEITGWAAVHFAEHVMTYCPEEQTGGKIYKDRRLSRLLK